SLIFMHLLFDNKFYLFALVSAIGCLLIFIFLTMSDTQFRGKVNAIERLPIIEQVPSDKFVQSKEGHHAADTPKTSDVTPPAAQTKETAPAGDGHAHQH
ncbi:MAG: hypothetical protein IT286_01170, partial [Proteobacteria bacterium]|nr:hypothetical protein [Pseudomonadota bacterium]